MINLIKVIVNDRKDLVENIMYECIFSEKGLRLKEFNLSGLLSAMIKNNGLVTNNDEPIVRDLLIEWKEKGMIYETFAGFKVRRKPLDT